MTLELDEWRPTLLCGGLVRSMDKSDSAAEAVLLTAGRVAGVGTRDELAAIAPADTQVVDVYGATILPGLIDTHPHLMHYGTLHHPLVDIADAASHDDIVARLGKRAAQTPPGEWIMSTPVGEPHYFLRRSWRDLDEGVLPDRHVLDRATAMHPIFVQAWAPVTPNVCVFNTQALAQLGLDRTTPDQVGRVTIEKDADGEPTGRLLGSVNNYYNDEPFFDALLRKVPLRDPGSAVSGTIEAMAAYNARGVTAVFEGHAMGHGEINLYAKLADEGRLSLRVQCSPEAEVAGMPWIERPLTDEEFAVSLQRARSIVRSEDDWLRIGGVTVSRPGPFWSGCLLMHRPYLGPYGEATTGRTFVTRQRAAEAARFCLEHDLRLSILATGEREHDEYLQDLEDLDKANPGSLASRNWILQHVYLLSEAQARRYADLGMVVTTSMSFSWGKGDLMAQRIGPDVLRDLIPIGRMLRAGMDVAAGTDWGPKNLFEQLQLSLTHQLASGASNLGPAQQIDRHQALALWTRNAAAVLGWHDIGSLQPGHHADLVVVDRDPITAPLDEIPETNVLATMVGGTVVHDADALRVG